MVKTEEKDLQCLYIRLEGKRWKLYTLDELEYQNNK
jgi:hypothetical protein